MAKRAFSPLRKFSMLLEAGAILPFVYLSSFFSFAAIGSIAEAIGRFIIWLSPSKIEDLRENLAVISPQKTYPPPQLRVMAARSQGYILRIFMELQKMSRMNTQSLLACIRLDSPNMPFLYKNSQGKTPQVFITLHAGNWELLGIFVFLLGMDMLSVVERQFNPYLDAYYQNLRQKAGIQTVYNEISLMRPLLKALKGGKCAALVADQSYWHDPLFLPFFGQEASAPKGVAGLILHTGALYSMGASAAIKPGVYRIFMGKPQSFSPPSSGDGALALTGEVYRFYENVIRHDPENWFLLGSPRWHLTRASWEKWAENPDSSQF